MKNDGVLTQNEYLVASATPQADIAKISYDGQPLHMRQYQSGYEEYFEQMPLLEEGDPLLKGKIERSKEVLQDLAGALIHSSFIYDHAPTKGYFNRTIIGMESPIDGYNGVWKEGKEILVAKWGDGFSSPIHGHSVGLMHEELLYGKMRINTYRLTGPTSGVVRLIKTEIVDKAGTIVAAYTQGVNKPHYKRQTLIHNFTSIGNSASLHYLPEHTRDGRDNQFEAEYFEDIFGLSDIDLKAITAKEGLYSRIGDVILVRSSNVPEYGDHYIVITGAPTMKKHGLRPRDVAIGAPHTARLFNDVESFNGLYLYKLNHAAQSAFLSFHDIAIDREGVHFPNA